MKRLRKKFYLSCPIHYGNEKTGRLIINPAAVAEYHAAVNHYGCAFGSGTGGDFCRQSAGRIEDIGGSQYGVILDFAVCLAVELGRVDFKAVRGNGGGA